MKSRLKHNQYALNQRNNIFHNWLAGIKTIHYVCLMEILLPKTDEEIILDKMKEQERSTHWLARQLELSQSYVYRTLIGPGKAKKDLTEDFRAGVKRIWPEVLFNGELPLPHEQIEAAAQSLKEKPLWKDEKNPL